MKRVMSATEARVHFGELMRQVVEHQDTVVVERGGEPKVVVLSVAEYEQLQAGQPEQDAWQARLARLHDQIRTERGGRPFPDVTELIHEMREERDAQILGNLRRR